jgi:hypothetical protein
MPIARYFVVVGGALAVLLLVAGWSLPARPTSFPDQPEIIERTVIRIRSERKWPEKVVMDTSKPTTTPLAVMDPPTAQSSVPLPSDEASDQSNLEAIAQLKLDSPPLTIDHSTLQIKRGMARTTGSRRVARGRMTHRRPRAKTGRRCCQFDRGVASSNAMASRRATPSWPFE